VKKSPIREKVKEISVKSYSLVQEIIENLRETQEMNQVARKWRIEKKNLGFQIKKKAHAKIVETIKATRLGKIKKAKNKNLLALKDHI